MSTHANDHKDKVIREFTQQAEAYAANPLIADAERLAAIVRAVRPQPGARVLDVATGPGYVAAAFAEAGCDVVGIDLTPAPLALAEKMRAARGLTGLRFQQDDAEHLPFEENTFDIIVSRYALHHCEDPRRIIAEQARVCRVQGVVAIQDLIVSEFPARGAYQNRFEQIRDTSHTRALSLSELMTLFTACGLEVEKVTTHHLAMPLEAWLENAHTDTTRAAQVRELIEQDAQHDLSGTHPFRKQEAVYFTQNIATLVARKIPPQSA